MYMKHIKKYTQFVNEGKMPDKYIGNDDIVYLKTKENSRGATYNLYYKGHDIDSGGRTFGSKKELEDFAKDYILSNQLYKKLRYTDPKPLPESVINEAHGDPIRTMEKVKAYLESEGETVEERGSKLVIGLPNQTKALPPKYKKIIQKVIKMSEGNMVAVKEATGYYMGNSLGFIFPTSQARLRKAYHVASAQSVDTILKNGLEPREAQAHSDQFGSSLGNSDMEQTYRAAFVVGSKKGIKIVKDLFSIQDPVVLEIDPKGIQFWEDPLMPKDAKSALTFQTIPADRIKRA